MKKIEERIGFSGKMTVGKTTISNLLAEKYDFVVLPIGGRIKKVCNLLIEDREELVNYLASILPDVTLKGEKETVEITNKALVELFEENYLDYIVSNGLENVFVKETKTGVYQKNEYYRSLTQEVGKCVRAIFGPQIWVSILLNEAENLVKQGKKVICDDVRLQIEYQMFKEKGYKLVRLDVEEKEQKKRILEMYETLNETALVHHTEVELDDFVFEARFDTTIDSVEETFKKVETVVLK